MPRVCTKSLIEDREQDIITIRKTVTLVEEINSEEFSPRENLARASRRSSARRDLSERASRACFSSPRECDPHGAPASPPVCCRCFGAATNRGIDNLAAHRQEARSPQSLVKTSEQDVDSTGWL